MASSTKIQVVYYVQLTTTGTTSGIPFLVQHITAWIATLFIVSERISVKPILNLSWQPILGRHFYIHTLEVMTTATSNMVCFEVQSCSRYRQCPVSILALTTSISGFQIHIYIANIRSGYRLRKGCWRPGPSIKKPFKATEGPYSGEHRKHFRHEICKSAIYCLYCCTSKSGLKPSTCRLNIQVAILSIQCRFLEWGRRLF